MTEPSVPGPDAGGSVAAPSKGASRWKQSWRRIADTVTWVPPTSVEVGTVAKSALAAGLAWLVATPLTGVEAPILASLTALVVIQVSARGSFRAAIERTIAVVVGVLLALAIGDAITVNALSVTVLVGASLVIAELVLRLPRAAARQVPVSVLVVLTTVSVSDQSSSVHRAADTLIGAVIGVGVSLALPASRLLEGRQNLERLATGLRDTLREIAVGLQHDWSTEQTQEWRRRARDVRERSVGAAVEALGNGRDAIRWNFRDRRHLDEFVRYEHALTTFERTAIGVSVISRGIDDHARLSGSTHAPMPSIGALLDAVADAIAALAAQVTGARSTDALDEALAEVHQRRARCVDAATRRAREALSAVTEAEIDDDARRRLDGEWLNYAAILVQVDRIVADLAAAEA